MWKCFKCFYKDNPFVEVKFQASLRRRPVIIGINKFKSIKSMNELICFLGFHGEYEIEVKNEFINKDGPLRIYKEFCLLRPNECIHIRMRALYV